MSRTYSNFLVFEDVLDNMPASSTVLSQALDKLLNPNIKIIEEDCGTLLGEMVDTSLELEGYIEVATGDVLIPARINALLEAGQYKTGVRTLHSCQSYLNGGICQKCYQSSFIGEEVPAVGKTTPISAKLIYQTDTLVGTGYTTEFTLSETSDDYDEIKVLNQGEIVDPDDYVVGFDTITFYTPPPNDPDEGIITVHFYRKNTEPFQGWIAKTYSGGLLGMQPLPTRKPLLRNQLYLTQFSDNFVSLLMKDVQALKSIPRTYIDFVDRVHDKMERILIAMYLFAIYSNVEA